MRTFLKFLAGALLAVALMVWVLRGTDPGLLVERIRQVSWPAWLACVVLNVGHNVFRVWRWGALLTPVRPKIPFHPMFSAVIVGYMTSWVFPGRIGELVRPLALSGQQGLPLGPCLGSVVADRVADTAGVVALFVAAVWLTPLTGPALEHAATLRTAALLAALGSLVVAGGMVLLSARSAALERWIARRGPVLRWVGNAILSLSEGARAFRSPRLALRIALHTLLAWLTIALAVWFGVRSAGAEITFGAVLMILPLLVLGVAVPTPGGAGSYHGLMKVGLMLFGVSELDAVSAGLIVHAAITLPIIVLGLLLLWLEGLSWRDLVEGARKLRTLGVPSGPSAPRAAGGRP